MTKTSIPERKGPSSNYLELPEHLQTEVVEDDMMLSTFQQIKELSDKHPEHSLARQFKSLTGQLTACHPVGDTLLITSNNHQSMVIKHTTVREMYDTLTTLQDQTPMTFQSTARRGLRHVLKSKSQKTVGPETCQYSLDELMAVWRNAYEQAVCIPNDISPKRTAIDTDTQNSLRNYAKELYTPAQHYEFSASTLLFMLLQTMPHPDEAWEEYIKGYAKQFAELSKAIADERRRQEFSGWALRQDTLGFLVPNDDDTWGRVVHLTSKQIAEQNSQIETAEQSIAGLQAQGSRLCMDIIDQLIPSQTDSYLPYPLSHLATKKALGKGGHHLGPFYPSTHTENEAFRPNSTEG